MEGDRIDLFDKEKFGGQAAETSYNGSSEEKEEISDCSFSCDSIICCDVGAGVINNQTYAGK